MYPLQRFQHRAKVIPQEIPMQPQLPHVQIVDSCTSRYEIRIQSAYFPRQFYLYFATRSWILDRFARLLRSAKRIRSSFVWICQHSLTTKYWVLHTRTRGSEAGSSRKAPAGMPLRDRVPRHPRDPHRHPGAAIPPTDGVPRSIVSKWYGY